MFSVIMPQDFPDHYDGFPTKSLKTFYDAAVVSRSLWCLLSSFEGIFFQDLGVNLYYESFPSPRF